LEAAGSVARDRVHLSVDYTPPFGPNRIFQVFISPLRQPGPEKDDASGVLLLLSDVSSVRKTEKIRSDFVANASHELKTPLTAIRGFTELIQSRTVTDPEQVQRYLDLIRKESDRLILLIADVLRLSELEGRALDSGISAVSLRIIAQKAALSLRGQAQEKSVTLNVEGDAGMLRANPDRMMQLFLNLMENAVKYNKIGGSVNVLITDSMDTVKFSVKDTGIGIPPEDKERVFERFFRVEQSHSAKIPGTGLGLSIVKHIVELYGGNLGLQSEPGQGTTVTVTFPLRPVSM
jgi:two-component system phosphate regulon sensor histidine kinase PhoR